MWNRQMDGKGFESWSTPMQSGATLERQSEQAGTMTTAKWVRKRVP